LNKLVGFDTETHLIQPASKAPPLVCFSYVYFDPDDPDNPISDVLSRDHGIATFKRWLRRDDISFVAHNAAFDLAVMMAADSELIPLVFAALEADRITCTLLREKLMMNYLGVLQKVPWSKLQFGRVGPYSLASCVDRHCGKDISEGKQADSWRLRFRELEDTPVAKWPREAYDYALEDSEWALKVFRAQNDAVFGFDHGEKVFSDQFRRARADLSLYLMGAWGLRVDSERVARTEERLKAKVAEGSAIFEGLGLYRETGAVNTSKLKDLVSGCYVEQGLTPPETDKGAIKTDRDTLLGTGHEGLLRYASLGKYRTLLKTFIPAIRVAKNTPVHPRFNVMVSSGRTSCSGPNVQNAPRETGETSIRECFIAREGRVFIACDYDTCEVRTLAQVLLDKVGWSSLAEAYRKNPDMDPHTEFAKNLVGGENKFLALPAARQKEYRQYAKAAVFGVPGGLGAETFRQFATGYGLNLTISEAKTLKKQFMTQWPELRIYFKKNSMLLDPVEDRALLEHNRSGRFRGDCNYTQLANTPFQGAAADGALASLFLVTKECFSEPNSPLYGSRPVLFIHDEIVISTPVDKVHEAAERLERLMVEGMERFTPDVPARASAVAMKRWSKNAKEVRDEQGRLIPWEETR